jgi:hypothetical protein
MTLRWWGLGRKDTEVWMVGVRLYLRCWWNGGKILGVVMFEMMPCPGKEVRILAAGR